MLFEFITISVFGGLAAKAFVSKKGMTQNDSGKIQRIISLSGLNVKDGNDTLTTQLIRKKQHSWGWEYKYRIPLGRSFDDYLKKQRVIQDGLNNRRQRVSFNDLKQLKWDKNILESLKTLWNDKLSERKEVEIDFDGLLVIRVYDKPLPTQIPFERGMKWQIPVGITRERNEFKYHDFDVIPHFVLGGATRYGKSNFINSMICSLLQTQPEHVHFFLIDLKGGVELSDYENIKQTVSIAYEPEEALKTLRMAYNKMRELQRKVRLMGKKKIEETNIKDRYFIIIDEVGELNPDEAVDKKDVKKDGILVHKSEKTIKEECQIYMSHIARLGAGLGFRQILATQYPTGDVIPRACKQNSDAKLSFRVQSETASRVALDDSGAELLPQIRGRAIYQTAEGRYTLQTPLITSDIIHETIRPHIVIKEVHDEKEDLIEAGGTNTVTFEEV